MTAANILSEIVRVKIERKTMEAAQTPPTGKRKQELRREAIMAYIRSKPSGEKIRGPEFAKIYGGTQANAYVFVQRMIRDGLIEKHNIGLKTFYYTIPGDVQLKEPVPNSGAKAEHQTFAELLAEQGDEERAKAVESEKIRVESTPNGPNSFYGYSTEDSANDRTEQKAKQFAWAYPELHNDLREFIKWLKSQT